MEYRILNVGILATLIALSTSFFGDASAQEQYVAAVTEYHATRDSSRSDYENLLTTTAAYIQHIQDLSNYRRARLIIFPEYGLTSRDLPSNLENVSTIVPNPTERILPCTNPAGFSKPLVDLSCAANSHGVYVVVNLVERANNTASGTIYYNTNVVFDSTGAVVARYRKINLLNESQFTAGEEVVSFLTDFGVTFGLVTSFDLLFKTPTMDLIRDRDVKDIIYPHAFASETPFLNALSLQDGFAKANGINLLASGYSDPENGFASAGIFLANATIATSDLSTSAVRNPLVGTVTVVTSRTPDKVCTNNLEGSPRIGTFPGLDSFTTTVENMEDYTFVDLELGVNETRGQICSEGSQFCCDYYVNFVTPLTTTSTVYKMAAFFGNRAVNGTTQTIAVRNCALLACTSTENSSCGRRMPLILNVQFNTISITSSLPKTSDPLYMPSTLSRELLPLKGYSYCTNDEDDVLKVTMTIEKTSEVLTFGIFGRAFGLDGNPIGRGGASAVPVGVYLIFSIFVAHFIAK